MDGGLMDGWVYKWMVVRWVDGWIDGWLLDEWIDRW